MKQILILLLLTSTALAQTGGTFDLSHSVIATGGGSSTGGTFRLDGTTGQHSAGTQSSATPHSVRAGFWMMYSLAPTSATVSVSGRVLDNAGRGISNAFVTITTPTGDIRSVQTGQMGHYQFEVAAGGFYLIEAANKRFVFVNPVRLLNIQDAVTDENFIGTVME